MENYEQFKRYIGEPIWKKFWQEVRIRNEELIAACTNGELDKVKKLVDPLQNMYPVDVNTKALDDWTPLHFAVASDNSDIVAFLIQNQADIEQLSSYDRTPLHIGALKGSYDSIKILIDSKVNIDAQDKDLYTALHYAAEYNHYDIVELLLKNGAKANILNHKQIYAYQAAKTPAIQELFKKYHQAIENPHSYNNNLLYGKEIGYSKVQFVEKMLQSQPWQQQQPPTNQVVVDPKQKKIEKEKNKIEKWQQIKPIAYQVVLEQHMNPNSFQFWKLLGKGAFGEVYLVTKDNNPTQKFAMKILRKDLVQKKKLQRYINTEKEVLNVMNHTFITKLIYAFQNADRLFLVLEYCPGGDLGGLLVKQRRVSEDIARIYIAEILLALEALHSKYIIYRDLKPENVLIGEDGHIKLTDFGLAKKTGEFNQLNQSVLGTPVYFAPEIVKRQGHTRQVDWYNLGILLYELLVGTPPYYANNREQLFENILKGTLRIPTTMSTEARDLIKSLLVRDYKKRLGAQRDGEEIREAKFFKNIDWSMVQEKKYQLPKPVVAELPKQQINIQFQPLVDQNDKFENWSVYNQDDFPQNQK